ncbi:unnamed protein product [Ectocarpus sp. 8 AP-2014]
MPDAESENTSQTSTLGRDMSRNQSNAIPSPPRMLPFSHSSWLYREHQPTASGFQRDRSPDLQRSPKKAAASRGTGTSYTRPAKHQGHHDHLRAPTPSSRPSPSAPLGRGIGYSPNR